MGIPALRLQGEQRKRAKRWDSSGALPSSDLPNEKRQIGFVRKAAELNDAGVKLPRPPKPKGPRTLEVPNDFTAALKKNAKARKNFENFSYRNRKEYLEWVTEAKRAETRRQRLATAIERLAEGKSRNWKYEPKR